MSSSADSLPAPRKVVPYYVADDPKGGALFLYGNPDSSNIAIFCAGFPDDHETGQAFCSNLAEKNKTLVGLMCLPGYDDSSEKPWTTHKKGGYTFDEMAATVRDAVKVLRTESTTVEKAKLTGIFHDWGVMPGLLWANRSLEDDNADSPDELVVFDVLPTVHKDQKKDVPGHEQTTISEKIITWAYRIVLAIAFALQLYVSKTIALVFFVPAFTALGILGLQPTLKIDSKIFEARKPPMDPHRVIYMAYPYLNVFKEMYKMIFSSKVQSVFKMMTLTKDLKKTPILYLYGTDKRIMFHDNGAVKYLEREAKENRSKSNAIAVENAGHWLYIHQPDRCLEEVMKFMAK